MKVRLGITLAFALMQNAGAQTLATQTYVSGFGKDLAACTYSKPCQTLQSAVDRTAPGGQVYALDSANFGYVTIKKSITISSRTIAGVLAGAGVVGVTVNAGPADRVTLNGLAIDGGGTASDGILFQSGGSLEVNGTTIRGFTNGVTFRAAAASSLVVNNSSIHNNSVGVKISAAAASSSSTLRDIQIFGNDTGVYASGAAQSQVANVNIQNSVVANNRTSGVVADQYSAVRVANSTIVNNGTGLSSTGGTLNVSQSTVFGNATGWSSSNGGQIVSAGNSNSGNTTDVVDAPADPQQPPVVLSKNIVTDFNALCDGKADAAPAFTAFNKWAVAQTGLIQLTIPSGSICAFTSGLAQNWAKGIKNLLVIGYGATITNNGRPEPGFFLGGGGQIQDNLHSARLATVSAGASAVAFLSPSQTSLFTVGNYALVTGFDLQGLWQSPYGYPSNPHWFEYVKVVSIDAKAGTVTFSAPLKNTYKSTWPNYNSGNRFEVDNGGPATIYALDPSWDTQVEYRGLTISQEQVQTYANGRSVTYRDVKFTGGHCGVPTQNLIWQAINTDMSSCNMEVDKLITSMVLDKVTINQIAFQSSSTDLVSISNSTITSQLNGTPKKAIISDTMIANLRPGAFAYGRSDEVVCTNCVFPIFDPLGVNETGLGSNPVDVSYSMSNGVISFPNGTPVLGAANNGFGKVRLTVASTVGLVSNDRLNVSGINGTIEANGGNTLISIVDATHVDLPEKTFSNSYISGGFIGLYAPRWAVPGTYALFRGSYGHGPIFQVLDVTQDQNFTYVHTNLSGGFPKFAGVSNLWIRVHPAPKFTCNNCSGGEDALDLSRAPAGAPLYSYSKRTYSASMGTTVAPKVNMWGTLTSAKINVTTPGTAPLQFQLSQFNNWPVMNDAGAISYFSPVVNMAIAGERTLTPTGVSGEQTFDQLAVPPNPTMFLGTSFSGPMFSAATAGSAQVTVELIANQGIAATQ